jgi:pimeloyl-ACP methyl ester carboxylesterase
MSEPTDFVFLHGGAQGGWVWDETIAALRQQSTGDVGRTLALDIPGCGAKRGRPTDDLGFDEIAAELVADIAAAGLSDAVLVGHSQAGSMLPRLLERRPDLFRQVIYLSCLAPLAGQTVMNWRDSTDRDRAADLAPPPADELRKLAHAAFCSDMTPEQKQTFIAKLGKDAWPPSSYAANDWRYDHLDATPASYFICLRDAIFSLAWQETFAERLKAERRVRLDAGHQVMNSRPQALAEALRHSAQA